MKRVTGIGGIFFKARDPVALSAWYAKHLGVPVQDWGGAAFRWSDDPHQASGTTAWSPFKADTDYFGPGPQTFMVNYRVDDLRALLEALKAEGCKVDERVEDSEFGKFGWVVDPEGNRVELWEAKGE